MESQDFQQILPDATLGDDFPGDERLRFLEAGEALHIAKVEATWGGGNSID